MNRLEQLEEMLKEDPSDPFLHYGIALEIARNGDVRAAVSRLESLISEQPEYLGAYYQLGQFHEQLNEPEKARGIYEKGILLAKKLNNKKTEGEMRSALDLLE